MNHVLFINNKPFFQRTVNKCHGVFFTPENAVYKNSLIKCLTIKTIEVITRQLLHVYLTIANKAKRKRMKCYAPSRSSIFCQAQ